MYSIPKHIFTIFLIFISFPVICQETEKMSMNFEEYNPNSTLRTPQSIITRAKYPLIDVHSHLWRMATMDLEQTVREMDSLDLKVLVNLSGRSGIQTASYE